MGLDMNMKVKGKTHDLNHDLTFSAHTINCVCHSIRSMFRVLVMYNFGKDDRKKILMENLQMATSKLFLTHCESVITDS